MNIQQIRNIRTSIHYAYNYSRWLDENQSLRPDNEDSPKAKQLQNMLLQALIEIDKLTNDEDF
jgi:hypothetical protein